MQVSARGDYAIRAALGLAIRFPSVTAAHALAEEQDMPYKFLEAILGDLRRAGLVQGVRGPVGGYLLRRPPTEITVGDVLRAVEGPLAGVRGQRPEETNYQGPAAHLPHLWVAVRAALRSVVDEVTLDQVATGSLPDRVRQLTSDPDAWRSR